MTSDDWKALVDFDYKPGDIIELINLPIKDKKRHFRLVVNSHAQSFSKKWGIKILYLMGDGPGYCIGDFKDYIPALPTTCLINNAKNQLNISLLLKSIDNLTYVEISAKLKENEKDSINTR